MPPYKVEVLHTTSVITAIRHPFGSDEAAFHKMYSRPITPSHVRGELCDAVDTILPTTICIGLAVTSRSKYNAQCFPVVLTQALLYEVGIGLCLLLHEKYASSIQAHSHQLVVGNQVYLEYPVMLKVDAPHYVLVYTEKGTPSAAASVQ